MSGPKLYRRNPAAMLSMLLGTETQGSLLAVLREEGVALQLSASPEVDMDGFTILGVRCGDCGGGSEGGAIKLRYSTYETRGQAD